MGLLSAGTGLLVGFGVAAGPRKLEAIGLDAETKDVCVFCFCFCLGVGLLVNRDPWSATSRVVGEFSTNTGGGVGLVIGLFVCAVGTGVG